MTKIEKLTNVVGTWNNTCMSPPNITIIVGHVSAIVNNLVLHHS